MVLPAGRATGSQADRRLTAPGRTLKGHPQRFRIARRARLGVLPSQEPAMRLFRFTIANLLGLVLFVAVSFAALRQADNLWDSTAFSLTLGLLLASVLLAIHRTEGRRAFWLGF